MIESTHDARAFAMLAKAGIRADNVTALSLARVMDNEALPSLPALPHSRAEVIGAQLSDYWTTIIGDTIPQHDDLAWADIVQFVIRSASQ